MDLPKQTLSIVLVLMSVLAMSCGQSPGAAATVTAAPSATSLPPTVPPTSTSSPTPSPTPLPAVGDTLRSDNWEATILQAVYRKSITLAGTVYIPKPGYMGFDVIVRVRNLNPVSNPSTFVENDVILDEHGESQLATCWGAHDVAKAEGKDLLELTFVGCQTGNIYTMDIPGESYVRFHFTIEDTNLGKTIHFKFEDLPAVPFIIDKTDP